MLIPHGLAHVLAHARRYDSMTRTTWGKLVVVNGDGLEDVVSHASVIISESNISSLYTAKPVISVV